MITTNGLGYLEFVGAVNDCHDLVRCAVVAEIHAVN